MVAVTSHIYTDTHTHTHTHTHAKVKRQTSVCNVLIVWEARVLIVREACGQGMVKVHVNVVATDTWHII